MPFVEEIRNIYLFKEMNPSDLAKLEPHIKLHTVRTGRDVFCQGDIATAVYMVRKGAVRIHQKTAGVEKIEVTVLSAGAHFGEMALVDDEPRSATAEVLEDSEILAIDYKSLNAVLDANPAMSVIFYRALAKFLCGRLRVTTLNLSFAREMNLRHF